jgi:hypothetical protein
MCHRVEAEIADIRLFGRNKSSQKDCGSVDQSRGAVKMNGQSNGFEKDSVLGVVMLDVSGRFRTVVHNRLYDLVEYRLDRRVL